MKLSEQMLYIQDHGDTYYAYSIKNRPMYVGSNHDMTLADLLDELQTLREEKKGD
jgi:hypothetical protein